MLCILFVGCTAKVEKEQANVTLKVLAWNETIFNQQYGNFFLATVASELIFLFFGSNRAVLPK
ncbi:hypothetical protein [Paenibacillus macerans]|uniref:hypothetical protein n=1 Tax=Paenibacillus macerans TaxID=44252 RepID=UPI00203F9819|nr:hypothetical protein [Paenibacillus macerans]MCM3701468.1 hypothetical protein [Paenibacillus macerans]